jgi:dephospho-CoA kinase
MSAFYITGVPGVGKSAVVKELNSRSILSIDIDDICNWVNKANGKIGHYYPGIGKNWIEAHSWLCDVATLKRTLDENDDRIIVLAGVTFNQNDYLALFDKIVLLQCRKEIFINRLNLRSSGNEYGKDKWEQEDILTWCEDFENNLINNGAIIINANQTIELVIEDIRSVISGKWLNT